MGRPAARVSDMHVCPMVTVLVPHVGGPVLPPGQINVLIGCLPAAHVGDMAVCVGPPDVVLPPGAFNVLIGGRPAARMGDMTAHGGRIVLGCFTVWIGTSGGQGSGAGAAGRGTPKTARGTGSGSPAPSCMRKAKGAATTFISPAADRFEAKAEKQWSTTEKPSGVKVGVAYNWIDPEKDGTEGQLAKWGDLQAGAYSASASSGYDHQDGTHSLHVIKAEAEFDALRYKKSGEAAGGVLTGGVDLKAGAVKAEARLGGEWGKNAKELHAVAGASADLVKGELKGAVNIPFFGWTISLGGSVEGQVGASAQVNAHAGWNKKDGFGLGVKAKAGVGLGAGLGFSIGIKPPP